MGDSRGDSEVGHDSGAATASTADPALLRVHGTVRVGEAGTPGALEIEVEPLTLRSGACVALLGRSGSGKTSLLAALFCDVGGRPGEAGRADSARACRASFCRRFMGRPWPAPGSAAMRSLLRDDVCKLPQDPRDAFDPLRTLRDSLQLFVGRARLAEAVRALHELGLTDGAAIVARYPHQVSGGQLRVVLLAVALARRPRLVVADEPSSGLDPARVLELANVFHRLRETGTAVLVATHDLDFAKQLQAECWSLTGAGRVRSLTAGVADLAVAWPRPREGETATDRPVVLQASKVGVQVRHRWILHDASLVVHAGESVALVGPNGAGKSTFAKVLAGMIEPNRGVCRHPSAPQRGIRGRGGLPLTQLLFQAARSSLTPSRTIRQLVAEGAYLAATGESVPFCVETEAQALGLDASLLDRQAQELSGGEARRAALLRALAARPAVLVLDEPTAELDSDTAVDVVRAVLAARRRARVATIWITHDHSLAAAVAERVVSMQEGRTR